MMTTIVFVSAISFEVLELASEANFSLRQITMKACAEESEEYLSVVEMGS